MVDFRPVAYVIGRILIVLAILMLAPAIIDWRAGLANGYDFLASASLTGVVGAALTLSTGNALGKPLDTRQAYLLTAGIWFLVPFSAAMLLGMHRLAIYSGAITAVEISGVVAAARMGWLQERVSRISDRQQQGTLIGTAIMGALSSLIVSRPRSAPSRSSNVVGLCATVPPAADGGSAPTGTKHTAARIAR